MTEFWEWREAPEAQYGLVGDPVSHSLSPAIHGALYRQHGLDMSYRAVRVPGGEFALAAERLAGLGYRGLNVTVPLKEEALEWAVESEGPAWLLGSVNTVALDTGSCTNTDVPAFASVLSVCGIAPGSHVTVLGAGGSARALVAHLAVCGHSVDVWSRDLSAGRGLIEELGGRGVPVSRVSAGSGGLGESVCVVDATSAGLRGEVPEIEWEAVHPGCLLFALTYGAQASADREVADRYDLRFVDGLGMLVEQAALSFEWWTNLEADRAAMMGVAHECLKSDG